MKCRHILFSEDLKPLTPLERWHDNSQRRMAKPPPKLNAMGKFGMLIIDTIIMLTSGIKTVYSDLSYVAKVIFAPSDE